MKRNSKITFKKAATAVIFFHALIAAAQIPNPGFETWTAPSNNPNGWGSANATTGQFPINIYTVEKATAPADVHSGTAAIKLTTKLISLVNVTAPGVAVSGDLSINISTQAVTISGGFPLGARPYKLTGWYKYAPQQNDYCDIYMVMWSRNGTLMDTVGGVEWTSSSATTGFMKFDAVFDYRNSAVPDSGRIVLSSSNPNAPVVNSVLIVDDLQLIFCDGLSVSVNTTDETVIGGADGTASAVADSGVAPYTYVWSNNATTSSLSGLSQNTYCVTVTDAEGCTVSSCGIVSSPSCAGFSVEVSTSDISVHGAVDGMAAAMITGGTAPFSYTWSNSATDSSLMHLSPGNYCVTVVDAMGCHAAACRTVADINCSSLSITVSGTDATSAVSNDGTAAALATGGTGAYAYSWSNNATTASISNLSPADYCVTVTDALMCSDSACVTIGFDSTTGMHAFSQNPVSVYPNPARTTINIEISNNDSFFFSLKDLNGKEMITSRVAGRNNPVSLSDLAPGVYFYILQNNLTQESAYGKLIVHK